MKITTHNPSPQPDKPTPTQLGTFSLSLAVRSIEISREFYEKLGFTAIGGDMTQNWIILRNGSTTIGLFQGMFGKNMLTFNPGWDDDAAKLEEFTDIRDLQATLVERGIDLATEVEEGTSGPGSFVIHDPDGNPIIFDQHV